MNTLLLAAALAFQAATQVVPFGTTVTVVDGSSVSYKVTPVNTNSWGPWVRSENGHFPPMTDGWVQFLSDDDAGWHGTTCKVTSGELQRVLPDGRRLDAPWWDPARAVWRKGWVRTAFTVVGASGIQAWPPEWGVKVKTNNSRVYACVHNSPTRCVYVEGNNNDVTVCVSQGLQSNNIQDMAAVNVKGSGNTLRGAVGGQMCGAFFDGPNNRALDLHITVEGMGDDNSGLYVRSNSDGFRATNTTVWMPKSQWPSTHGRNAFYIDDKSGNAVLYNCAAYGPWDRGVFVHGGSNNRVQLFRSLGPKMGVLFAPHFQSPTVTPTGNTQTGVTEVKN